MAQKAFSSVEFLISMVISMLVVLSSVFLFKITNQNFYATDAHITQNELNAIYSRLIHNPKVKINSIANNAALKNHIESAGATTTVAPQALNLYNETGSTIIIPSTGLFLNAGGQAVAESSAAWKITAKWQGFVNNSYSIFVDIENISSLYNIEPTSSLKNIKAVEGKRELSCFQVTSNYATGPCRGHACGATCSQTLGWNDSCGYDQRPKDVDLTKVQVACPQGTKLVSVIVLGGCNNTGQGAYPLMDGITGECRQFTGNTTNCGGSTTQLACRATCCKLP